MSEYYYICLNCGRIQRDFGRCEVERCGGATNQLSADEVEEYKNKILNKKMKGLS